MPSDLGTSHPGQRVNPAVLQTLARVMQDSWSTPRASRPERDSPGRSGRNREPLEPGASRPGQLVDPAGHRALARVAQDHGSTPWPLEPSVIRPGELVEAAGPLTHARVAWENSLIPRTIRPGPERNGRAGRPRGPSDLNASCPGHLVDPMGPGNRAQIEGQMFDTLGTRSQARVTRDSW